MDTKSLTYAELGDALGIAAASAKRLSIRHRWQKHQGNDGKARVTVPVEYLQVEKPVARDVTSDLKTDVSEDVTSDNARDDTGDSLVVVTTLERHIGRLETELAKAESLLAAVSNDRDRQRADKELERAKAAQVDVLKAVLEAEQRRSNELKEERDRWQKAATEPRGLFAWLKRTA